MATIALHLGGEARAQDFFLMLRVRGGEGEEKGSGGGSGAHKRRLVCLVDDCMRMTGEGGGGGRGRVEDGGRGGGGGGGGTWGGTCRCGKRGVGVGDPRRGAYPMAPAT